MLILDVTPGVVSTFFFFVFDLFVLTFVDFVVTKIVCALHYRDINAGIPVEVKSVDVLGLTSYLVGRRLSVANIGGLIIKLSFVIMVFSVNLNIESDMLPKDTSDTRNGTFDFKLSEAELDLSLPYYLRRMRIEQNCRVFTDNKATFYRLIFDAKKKTFHSPTSTKKVEIDESSYICLKPTYVIDPVSIFTVTGCSTITGGGCWRQTSYRRPARLDAVDPKHITQTSSSFHEPKMFGFPHFKYDNNQTQDTFPEYTKPVLHCIELCISTQRCCATPVDTDCVRADQECMLLSFNSTHTLLERWTLRRENERNVVLTRLYPGPIIDREIFLNLRQTEYMLLYAPTMANWLDLATFIYREGFVYETRNTTFRELKQRTKVPTASIVLGVVMLVVVALTSVVVSVTIDHNKRPLFNTIDGLSSIAMEEKAPSIRSVKEAPRMYLALTPCEGGALHFGPVDRTDNVVPRNGRWVTSGYHARDMGEELQNEKM